MNLIAESLWITENFVSLVADREDRTGEWLGADALADDIEVEFDHVEGYFELDEYDAERVQSAYDSYVYGSMVR